MRPTAWLTSRSSPVSATKSIHKGRSSACWSDVLPAGSMRSTRSAFARSSLGPSGRIQSRESTDSAAMADEAKLRKCPKSEVMPYQRTA
jgi:hypothetical protein